MAGQNSNIRLQEIVDDARSLGDTSPALSTGGYSDAPAISIANDVMLAIINGGSASQPFNWKWNRINVTPFPTISYQQDYFVPGVVNVGWLEHAWASQINQASIPKQKQQLEVRKDLDVSYDQTNSPAKICWLPNDLLQTGTWGINPLGPTVNQPSGNTINIGPNIGGLQNPGPNVIYTNPIGTLNQPVNATTCIKDPNGNLWNLTTYGTCGANQPTWTVNPVYPTVANPTIVASTVNDGSCVWTAINPKGQGFRLSPVPPQTGVTWLIVAEAQTRAPRFSSLNQTLEPLPDDYSNYFKQGFFAECYRRNPDPKIRGKYPMERQLFLEALDRAVRQADREEDDYGFYPGTSIMDSGVGVNSISPSNPYGPWGSI